MQEAYSCCLCMKRSLFVTSLRSAVLEHFWHTAHGIDLASGISCRNKQDFIDDIRDQYKEMRDEFMAGLEDRKYLTIEQVRAKGPQVTILTH